MSKGQAASSLPWQPAATGAPPDERTQGTYAAVESMCLWMFETMRKDAYSYAKQIGVVSVGMFFEVWVDTPSHLRLRSIAYDISVELLHVIEDSFLNRPDHDGRTLSQVELLQLTWYRLELRPDSSENLSSHLRSVEGSYSEQAEDTDMIFRLRVCHLRELLNQLLPGIVPIGSCCLKRRSLFESIRREMLLAYPCSRSGPTISDSLGSDLRIVCEIIRCVTTGGAAKIQRNDAPSLHDFCLLALGHLSAEFTPNDADNFFFAFDAIQCFNLDESAEGVVQKARELAISLSSEAGCMGHTPHDLGTIDLVRWRWVSVRALRPRTPASDTKYQQLAVEACLELRETCVACAELVDMAAMGACWLGVPDGVHGDQTPVVQVSSIGGVRGRGLFTQDSGRPIPLEFLLDTAYGQGGYITPQECDVMSSPKNAACDFIVSVVLGVWFRDEFTQGGFWGTIRPLSVVMPRWLRENRCVQDIQWDEAENTYTLNSEVRTTFVTKNDISNLAAMVNDALYKSCASEAEYNRKDAVTNNLVMVPCARPTADDPSKLEFSSVWIYPRHGWQWGSPQELTLGYGWEYCKDA